MLEAEKGEGEMTQKEHEAYSNGFFDGASTQFEKVLERLNEFFEETVIETNIHHALIGWLHFCKIEKEK